VEQALVALVEHLVPDLLVLLVQELPMETQVLQEAMVVLEQTALARVQVARAVSVAMAIQALLAIWLLLDQATLV
jgi:hypothetical protein